MTTSLERSTQRDAITSTLDQLKKQVVRLTQDNEELRRDKASFRDHSDESRRNLARMRVELEAIQRERQNITICLERQKARNEALIRQLKEEREEKEEFLCRATEPQTRVLPTPAMTPVEHEEEVQKVKIEPAEAGLRTAVKARYANTRGPDLKRPSSPSLEILRTDDVSRYPQQGMQPDTDATWSPAQLDPRPEMDWIPNDSTSEPYGPASSTGKRRPNDEGVDLRGSKRTKQNGGMCCAPPSRTHTPAANDAHGPQASPSQELAIVKLEGQSQPHEGLGRDAQPRASTPRSQSQGPVPGDDTKGVIPAGTQTKLKSKKGDVLDLPPSVVEAYLRDIPRFPIFPEPNFVGIKRKLMRLTYGGSDRQLVQCLAADKNPSSNTKRNLVWPMPDDHPAIPRAPGEPGLMFAGRTELRQGTWSVFTRNVNKASAEWTYMGEYENSLAGTMTKDQFIWQSNKVKQKWVKRVATKKSEGYMAIRARIALRKAGAFPVDDKEQGSTLVEEEAKRAKDGRGVIVTEKDVLDAFTRGDEGITILRMKCIAYDRQFVDHVENAHRTPQSVIPVTTSARPSRSQLSPTRGPSLPPPTDNGASIVSAQVKDHGEDSDGGLSYVSEGEESTRLGQS